MALIVSRTNNKGTRDILIILGSQNIERMQEKDQFELNWWQTPYSKQLPGTIGISYATDVEMMQWEQLARQGKQDEVIRLATSGWKYRAEKGDHDLGPRPF